MIEQLAFYFFAFLVIVFFSISIISKNVLYALSSLAAAMVLLSSFYFLLDAEFLGVIQIIVYGGAVLGLYSFAMMFFDFSKNIKEKLKAKKTFVILSLALALVFAFIAGGMGVSEQMNLSSLQQDISKNLAALIFSKYLLAFEFIAVLLLIALVCAIVLTHKELGKEE
ncbi:NADH-quinone oxidoreductase subunit J [Campylobacter sp. US33a]|uniref:NADH-quinone oxidoreductase subunit J n=1 Tax=Campylobacter sp. CCS1377 TaxID=3158229 RepID=A0AAU7E879_9BACT|nr:NADH-quinone oxidoreductase subunit J [Campylobacter sp. US33a]MCW1359954.1 NADH-quinone oxidoreductase subunit J [Campylobacter jejuni]TEY03178.1 NADH-quinone oxidoreductase subunit J [Campylobacter sp. US33a]